MEIYDAASAENFEKLAEAGIPGQEGNTGRTLYL
jgi:hypothetical protein